MTRVPMIARLIAITIAILAAIDPAITSNRTAPPEISVIAADPRDSVLATRVAQQLSGTFRVFTAPLPSADATVFVGDQLPAGSHDLATPVFAVTPSRDGPTATIEALRAPGNTPLDARVAIEARVHVTAARGQTVTSVVRLRGAVVDQAELAVTSDDTVLQIPLIVTPTTVGAASIRVTATIKGASSDRASDADLVIGVRDTKWSVLFFDPRPAWQSTFVRRAIEADARFVVTSRITTSKNISTDVGVPPSLDDAAALSRFDAIVVGAPEALSEREVSGLDTYLRHRGGNVVLLFDQRVDGPVQRLLGATTWRDNGNGRVTTIRAVAGAPTGSGTTPADSGDMRAASLTWPTHLPEGAEVLARSAPAKGDTTPSAPVVWRTSVGAGRIVASGALDAWRFRDAAVSAFDGYWRTLIADAASASPPPIAVHLTNNPLTPGESFDVGVTLRDAALQSLPARASLSAELQSLDGSLHVAVRLWPNGGVGELVGTVRAPAVPGVYRIVVNSDRNRADGFVVVARDIARATPNDRELVEAWTRSRGGKVIAASQLSSLPGALKSAIHPAAQPTRWHPMHSLWWLLPFALALSFEWWWRRRRGLR